MSVEMADFAASNSSHFPFGATNESVAAGLRKLAQEIEQGLYAVIEVTFAAELKKDDFATGTWNLKFHCAARKPE